jgi:polysaccharide export outer membrane protein
MRLSPFIRRGLLVLAPLAATALAAEKPVRKATRVEPPPPATGASSTYKLTEQDVVHVVVFGEEELTVTTRIGRDGCINMPMVGLVRIAGQSIRESASTLERELREYLVKPQVTVTIVAYTKRKITILGQVNRPGTYDLPDEESLDITQAIGMAGGYTRIANTKKITIKRTVNGRVQTIQLDGRREGETADTERTEVLPGDTITVHERIL